MNKNLVARGEVTKPPPGGNGGGVNPTTSPYDNANANHNVLGNTMDASADGAQDFGYGQAGGSTDY
jgi:hypothetical protein